MKRAVGVLMIMMFLITTIIPSVVLADNTTSSTTTKINEYELLKELKSKTDIELQKLGYKPEDIEKIKSLDYREELIRRSNLDVKTLKNMGYNDKQINMLKSFKGTEEEIMALAVTLTFTATKERYAYSSSDNYTYFNVSYEWEWSNEPLMQYDDIIGFGWSSDFLFDESNPYTYHDVYYKSVVTGDVSRTRFKNTEVVIPGQNSQTMFPVAVTTKWAKEGYGWIQIRKAGQAPECQMVVKYGHTTLSITPALAYPWGVGFGFVTGVQTAGSKTVNSW